MAKWLVMFVTVALMGLTAAQSPSPGARGGAAGGQAPQAPANTNTRQITPPLKGSTYGVIAEVKTGKLLVRNEDGMYMFKGIPYAQAERWEMPVKAKPWEDLLNANYVGPVCPQVGGSGEYLSNPAYYRIDYSEKEFLNLNVWSPDMKPVAPKPVIVWIHGGGYSNGSSNELLQYDGKNLARFGDIVLVSVNHRINYLGYLDLSAYGEKFKNSGNVGHADLIMALEWVRDNIATFGGDPTNVTIFGQSGGSMKVSQLMAMPAASGLFKHVVASSSGSYAITTTKAAAQERTATLVKSLGLAGKSNDEIVAYLKKMPYNDLAAAAAAARISVGASYDNEYVLPDISYSARKVDLIVGSVMAEFVGNAAYIGVTGSYRNGTILKKEADYYYNNRLYATPEDVRRRYQEKFGDQAAAAKAAFQKAYPGHDLFDGLYAAPRDNNVASQFTKAGGTAYEYVVAYVQPLFGGLLAQHTTGDIAFWFRNLDTVHTLIAGDEKVADKVSREMAGALVSFARSGKPTQPGLAWPAFSLANGETIIFDRTSAVRNYHDKEFQALMPRQAGRGGF